MPRCGYRYTITLHEIYFARNISICTFGKKTSIGNDNIIFFLILQKSARRNRRVVTDGRANELEDSCHGFAIGGS